LTITSKATGTNSAVFSTGYQYYINYFSDANTPTQVTLHNSQGKLIRTLEDNKAFSERMNEYKLSKKEFFSFKTTQGVVLNGWIIKPLNFDPTNVYPVLMTQYSGPNSQEVTNDFGIGWEQALAANGYMVACVDGRGTGARGEEFRKMTYLELGKYETIDQIETAKYLGNLPYVDANRIGIWGWSYGGFMALNCITQGADVFKMAIAVAPVTNWRYYDNIYTERFMRTPAENPDGYDLNSPINHVQKFKGKLLLIHGTADDNVPTGESLQYYMALKLLGKDAELVLVKDENHFIIKHDRRIKWHYTILGWFDNKLKEQPNLWNDMYPEKNL